MRVKLTASGGEPYGPVYVDGERLSPADSQAVVNHSPDGFSWGYDGSGPSQLALALLLKAGVPATLAVKLHHDFRDDYVATWKTSPTVAVSEINVNVAGWAYGRLVTRAQAALALLLAPTTAKECGFLVNALRGGNTTDLQRAALTLAAAIDSVVLMAQARPV